jgi:hypothetical protein
VHHSKKIYAMRIGVVIPGYGSSEKSAGTFVDWEGMVMRGGFLPGSKYCNRAVRFCNKAFAMQY